MELKAKFYGEEEERCCTGSHNAAVEAAEVAEVAEGEPVVQDKAAPPLSDEDSDYDSDWFLDDDLSDNSDV